MKLRIRWFWAAMILLGGVGAGSAAEPAAKIAVKFVVVTDLDFAAKRQHPGLFEVWVASEHFGQTFAVPGVDHPVVSDGQGTLVVLVGAGNAAAVQTMALAADDRFDFSRAYWLVSGIGFANPAQAALGSAIWGTAVVNGDAAFELDRSDAPGDWPYGVVPLDRSNVPADYPVPSVHAPDGVLYRLNPALTKLALSLSATLSLPELPELRTYRGFFAGYPAAVGLPSVKNGTIVGSSRLWHGKALNQWATDWVQYWSKGGDPFLIADASDQAVAAALTALGKMGRVDFNRVMVLRAAAGYTISPPNQSKDKSLQDGFRGPGVAAASAYLAARPIYHEIVGHWARYADKAPEESGGQQKGH